MSFCFDLCNCANPHGCCNPDSILFQIWTAPFIIISCPIWMPIVMCIDCYKGTTNIIDNNIRWSEKHRNNYDTF
jgi:hypothetical protein